MQKLVFSLSVCSGLLLASSVSANFDLTPLSHTTDALNTEHATYQQYYQGDPSLAGKSKFTMILPLANG